MIVSCEKCRKNFNIQDDLIPKKGRLLQCSNCNYKWFYIPQNEYTNLEDKNNNDLPINQLSSEKKEKIKPKFNKDLEPIKKKEIKAKEKKIITKISKSSNLIKKSFISIISIIALLILVDTFKLQLEKYIPGINFLLNNLYETLKDLFLFAKDLVN